MPEPQQIVIRPFDASALGNITKAIQSSDLGLAPNSDGRLIRLNVPPLSTERRKQLLKLRLAGIERQISYVDSHAHSSETVGSGGLGHFWSVQE